MLATGVCVLSMIASQLGAGPEPAATPVTPIVQFEAATDPAGGCSIGAEARALLTPEELSLLEGDPRMLVAGGDDTEEMWSAYAAVGIASVAAIVILILIF